MGKIVFLPVSLITGLLAGVMSKKLFQSIWGLVDEQEPPRAEHRRVGLPKLALALAIEGALFRVVKGLVDHGSREGFSRLTGSWPGEEAPQAE